MMNELAMATPALLAIRQQQQQQQQAAATSMQMLLTGQGLSAIGAVGGATGGVVPALPNIISLLSGAIGEFVDIGGGGVTEEC
mmetsp:Transcript_31878/g.101554  ORF Transcript_31878/g.101554 Transcript_31878/m.101554 type:complete len:83 (+) Transcript_31878:1-249(+)